MYYQCDGHYEVKTALKIIVSLLVILIYLGNYAGTMDLKNIECYTDKKEYIQGDNVAIHIRNNSADNLQIVNRNIIDGGFATIEIKLEEDKWKTVELITAANIITFKTLKRGDSHTYIWKTKGYNRSDTLAIPGAYRIILNIGIRTNEFKINNTIWPHRLKLTAPHNHSGDRILNNFKLKIFK